MKTKKLINALVLVVLSVVLSLCATACAGKKYTVTLDVNGGQLANNQTTVQVTLNKNYTLPTPTKVGYTFEGWMQGTSLIATTGKWTIEGDISVKAEWAKRVYNITLDVNGGDALSTSTLTTEYNEPVQLPTPTKAGYTFDGWTLNGEDIGKGVITWEYDDDATLVAKWLGSTTQVTISANGGQGLENAVVTATKGEVLALPTLTKTGYTFAGWLLNEQPYDATSAWNLDSATATLVAQWTANTYTITIDVNGGNALANNTVNVTFNEVIELPSVTKTGSQVDKWLYGQNEVDVTKPWNIAENVTITVQWKASTTLVTFNVNGGVELADEDKTATFTYGEQVTLPTTTKAGYQIAGWKYGQTVYNSSSVWNLDATEITLVADWIGNTIPVTFNVRGGSAVNDTTFTFGQKPYENASDIPTTSKANCAFDGWLYNGELVDLTQIWETDVNSIELVAKWTGRETTVTVKYGISGVEDEEVTIVYGDVYDLSYDRKGYILVNYVIEGTDTEIPVTGDVWDYEEDKTLVAVWQAKTYNITIKAYDGSLITATPIIVAYDSTLDLLPYVPSESIIVNGKQIGFHGFTVEGTETIFKGPFKDMLWNYDSETSDIVLAITYGEDIWI